MSHPINLAKALEIIAHSAALLPAEAVPLNETLSRVCRLPLSAKTPQPGYNQSMRDGFVLASGGDEVGNGRRFRIDGEAPAGNTKLRLLPAGIACRIMTGGMVPEGGLRVVPQEDCVEENGTVTVPTRALLRKNCYIQCRGDQVAAGDLLVAAGTILEPGHLALLAMDGQSTVEVHPRPRVGFFSTGTELVDSPEQLVPGLKISSNRYLLGGLLRQFLAEGEDLGLVRDVQEDLGRIFARLSSASFDVVVSTGGMGPGTYDLLEEAFFQAGGEVLFRSLNMRPGRSTLFGRLGSTLFFGLPGPPEAVRTLMNELVGPTVLQLQGVSRPGVVALRARLLQGVEIRNNEVLHIKPGILDLTGGDTRVRLAGRLEIPACYILFSPGQGIYGAGSDVEVHLAYSPSVSLLFTAM